MLDGVGCRAWRHRGRVVQKARALSFQRRAKKKAIEEDILLRYGGNKVDAKTGRTTNIIEFTGRDHPAFRATRSGTKKSPLQSLNVVLSATAVSATRIELVFRYVKPRINVKLFGLAFALTLVIPVPGPFITRILFFFRPKEAVRATRADISAAAAHAAKKLLARCYWRCYGTSTVT